MSDEVTQMSFTDKWNKIKDQFLVFEVDLAKVDKGVHAAETRCRRGIRQLVKELKSLSKETLALSNARKAAKSESKSK